MKKVLSFVLSVAMVICLMPMMAFADDDTTNGVTATGISQFSDADSINNKEAVAVLVGLGIIDGMGDGTFQPQGDLTRAQASKLVATVVKSGDKSDIPAPAADPFTDVQKSHWAAGAVKFGVDNGYINGMGDGTFHPDDQVTTAQLATMLDKLLGYSVEDINYQWPENAMAKATESRLLVGITKGATDNLNREEAAQMIFNALKANTKVKNTTTGSDSSLVDGSSLYNNVPNKESDDYRTFGKDSVQQLIEKYFPKAVFDNSANASDDVFGRPASVWKSGREKITDEIIKQPVLTYTDREVSSSDVNKASDQLKEDLNGYITTSQVIVDENDNVVQVGGTTLKKNGEVSYFGSFTDSDKIADKIAAESGNGILVEIYANDKDTEITDVIIIDYDLDKVQKVNSKDGSITLKNGTIDKKASFYSQISSAAKDDYVLVALQNEEVIDAYLPTAVENAAVTKITNESKDGLEDKKATIGGTEYTFGHDKINPDLVVNSEDEGTAYLDKYGYLVAYDKEKAEASDWALLVSTFTANENNSVGETSTDVYGIIVTEDGTDLTVPLMYTDDTESDRYDAATKKVVDNFKKIAKRNGSNYFLLAGTLVTYKEAAAGYKLDTTGTKSEGITGDAEINKNTTKIGKYYLSNEVKVITVSGKKASTLDVSVADKLTKTVAKGEYKYVEKVVGNNDLVTAIYITGDAKDSTTINVTRIVGDTAYDSTKTGTEIEYYTDDSTDVQTGIVEQKNITATGWYTVDEFKDGMKATALSADKYVDADIEYGCGATAYGSAMSINDTDYELASDATVVDLDDIGIASVEDLVAEIAKITAKEGTAPIHVEFTWKVDDNKNIVRQVYVSDVTTAVAPEDQDEQTPDDQTTPDEQTPDDQTTPDEQTPDDQTTPDDQASDDQTTPDDQASDDQAA